MGNLPQGERSLGSNDTTASSYEVKCSNKKECYWGWTVFLYFYLGVVAILAFVFAIVLRRYGEITLFDTYIPFGSLLLCGLLVAGGLYIWYSKKHKNKDDKKFGSEMTDIKSTEVEGGNAADLKDFSEEAKHQKILLYLFIAGFFVQITWFIGSVIYTNDKIKKFQWYNRIAALVALSVDIAAISVVLAYEIIALYFHEHPIGGD